MCRRAMANLLSPFTIASSPLSTVSHIRRHQYQPYLNVAFSARDADFNSSDRFRFRYKLRHRPWVGTRFLRETSRPCYELNKPTR
jgi:hypothetical protein